MVSSHIAGGDPVTNQETLSAFGIGQVLSMAAVKTITTVEYNITALRPNDSSHSATSLKKGPMAPVIADIFYRIIKRLVHYLDK